MINCGCATIKTRQKPIGDGRLLTDRERLLIGDGWMLIDLMQPDIESGYEQEDTQQKEARRDPLGCRRLPPGARIGTVLRSQCQRIRPQMRDGTQDPDDSRQNGRQ
ncbi:hypothetical protein THICB3180037 [Thiomonas sp. CB3]|nr:hypothetical protein THICB3180037 [Thiomonas sp. CB3]